MPNYSPADTQVIIKDSMITDVVINMKPTYATLNITSADDAKLYINNEYKNSGSWSGRMEVGIYTLEARKDKHRNARQDIELKVAIKKK